MASITKCGDGWRVRIRRRGAPDISKNFPNRYQAERWSAQVEAEVFTRGNAFPQKGTKLRELLERYLREITPRKKGWKQETVRIKAWLRHEWADRDVTTIRSSEVSEWRRQCEAAGQASNTIRINMSLLSHVFRIAVSEWGYEHLNNPFQKVIRPSQSQSRERRLFPGEEERLLKAASEISNNIGPAIVLALETGMRRGELARIEPSWVRGRVVFLPDTKNSEPRGVPLSSRAMDMILALQPQSRRTLLNMTPDAISHSFTKVCKSAGITGLRFHDLRHEATSRFFEKGLSMMEVASITGHKSLAMLRRYTHLSAVGLADKLG